MAIYKCFFLFSSPTFNLMFSVEGVIYTVEAQSIRASMVQTALARLRSANARIFGGVLTKFDARKGHLGYGYDYGYGYGREDAEKAARD